MKTIALLVLLAVSACAPASAKSPPDVRKIDSLTITTFDAENSRGNFWVTRIEDSKTGATCYSLSVDAHLSCIK